MNRETVVSQMKNEHGYMRTIEEVRKIKRKISAEIKGMTSQEYFDYLDKNVAHLRERFKKKYVTLP